MTSIEFDTLITSLNQSRKEIVEKKRPEYTEGNEDVLHNFKMVAKEIGVTPIQAWYIYFRKHVASISQFGKDPKRQLSEPIQGRIADAMNYLELLYALIYEEAHQGLEFDPSNLARRFQPNDPNSVLETIKAL